MRALPVCALDEDMLMMRPQPAASMSGSTACVQRNMLFKFTNMTFSHSASVTSRKGRKEVMPALLTRICTLPSSAWTRSTPASI